MLCAAATFNTAFDVGRGEAIVDALKTSMPANAVANYLGCDDSTAAAILADGHSTRIFADLPRLASRSPNAIQRVKITSLDDFMAQMFERATPIDGLSLYVEPIGKAAKHLHWQADRRIRLVLAGKVPLFCLRNRREFNALCVDRQDFRWILSALPLSPCLTKDQAAAQLGVDVHAVDLLVRAACQNGSPLIRRVQPMSGKWRNRWHLLEEDFAEFQAEHVTLVKIAEENHTTPSAMATVLAARGIDPVNIPRSGSYRFYRRSEL